MNLGRTVSSLFFFYYLKVIRSSDIVEDIHGAVDSLVLSTVKTVGILMGKKVEPQNVRFYISTSSKRNVTEIMDTSNPKEIVRSNGNIFFLIHGWSKNMTSCPWYNALTDVLLEKYSDSQIVMVDWDEIAGERYPFSAYFAEGVGKCIASLIELLVQNHRISLQNIVIIGHSLGGQIAGMIGKYYQASTKTRLPRIIALDPAAPIFRFRPSTKRLNENDADAVIVIHSDIFGFGYPKRCGTIDFYPNGGFDQPGCRRKYSTVEEQKDAIWCSHRRCSDIFIESLKRPLAFMAMKCDSFENYQKHICDNNEKVSIGDWETSKRGSYYIKITVDLPFIKH
ncbi:phospholipase A1-like [Harmonia axyridis]|uniref:phospholipase A1-like n=1 Tax=Harmonia axyridis TaxID=115357 RepID=UPI001E278826|nr:phospholipase A1-like [Harmonia axyridis]